MDSKSMGKRGSAVLLPILLSGVVVWVLSRDVRVTPRTGSGRLARRTEATLPVAPLPHSPSRSSESENRSTVGALGDDPAPTRPKPDKDSYRSALRAGHGRIEAWWSDENAREDLITAAGTVLGEESTSEDQAGILCAILAADGSPWSIDCLVAAARRSATRSPALRHLATIANPAAKESLAEIQRLSLDREVGEAAARALSRMSGVERE